MAQGGAKRKRNDRQFSQDDGSGRPSPHRPESLNLAQQNQRHDRRNGGGRHSRGGQGEPGGHGTGQNHHNMSGQRGTPNNRSLQNTSEEAQPVQVSRPTTPAPTPRPQPQYMPPPSPPRGPPAPYAYEHVTGEIVSSWKESGKKVVCDKLGESGDSYMASICLQELLRSCLDGRLDPNEAGSVYREAAENQADGSLDELQTLLVDSIAMLDDSEWKRSAIRSFVAASGVPAEVWREQLDVETLTDLGLVRKAHFQQTKIRKQTNLLYRQANYNLLREETEGYAKLITESFNTAMTAGATDSSPTIAEDAFQRVKALVGSFDLDVGRVLDITLDVFANLLVRNFRFFVKYIRASSWWPEDSVPEVIQWESQGFESLPGWALPGSGDWGMGPEEAERTARIQPLKQARDVVFWEQVRQVGMDAFFDIGARRITNYDAVLEYLNTEVKADLDARGGEKDVVKRKRLNDAKKWMRETKTLPPPGNADAAQILGFKLAFYTSPARDREDVMPENLVYLTALLIKIGFISLRDLYPHLYPLDADMPAVKERLTRELEEKERLNRPGGAARNALAMAGALADDTAPPPPPPARGVRDAPSSSKAGTPKPESTTTPAKASEEPKEKLPEPPDQKILLLESLLAIGAIPDALFILGRFPWLADVVPDIPEHIHRLLHYMLTKVYDQTRPLAHRAGMSEQQSHIGDPAAVAKGSINRTTAPPRITKRWAKLDRADLGDGIAFKFYWDDWADNVPVCQSVDDVFLLCGTLLNFTGVRIGKDPLLLLKLARIGKASLQSDRSHANDTRWIDLLKRLLVPALSLTSKNPGLVNEVYDLLRLFPISARFGIYAEWHFGPTSRLPAIKNAFENTRAETKDVLRRISKTNLRAMGKQLAKIAYSSPGVVLQVTINQIISYTNMIDVVVEGSRYFTYLGYDVLNWCLLNALGGAGLTRMQEDGMLTSPWLKALSTFTGTVFKRYSTIDPAPVLQYLANELRHGETADLEILDQVITTMTGIRSDMEYNDAQVLAMAGGEILRSQTIKDMADERHKHDRTSKRLMRSLLEPGLAGQLLISIAQERQMYANHESSKYKPLKVLGSNMDKIHQVFTQYLDALRHNLTSQEFDAAVPDILTLIRDFGLEPSIAFMIGRATMAASIAAIDAARKLEQQDKARRASLAKLQSNVDTTMTDVEEKPVFSISDVVETKEEAVGPVNGTNTVKSESSGNDPASAENVLDVKDVAQPDGLSLASPAPTSALAAPGTESEEKAAFSHPALSELVTHLPKVLGQEFESTISVPFYVTFWTLSLHDLLVNPSSYDHEVARQTQLANQIRNDRSDATSAGARERDRKIKAITELKERLTQEMKTQIGAYTQVRNRLSKEKDNWFLDFHGKVDLLHTSILQNCFLPRMLLSPLDAHYTFLMLKFLHNSGAPGFRTMHLVDRLLRKNQLAAVISSCTSGEVQNFGRFLNELLKELQGWHADKTAYEKNAFGAKRQLPGFARKFTSEQTPETFLEYEDFRRLMWKWHGAINNALKHCLNSGEYYQIRSSISILKEVHQNFPAVNFHGRDMIDKITNLIEHEERNDIKLSATVVLASLRKREEKWVLPQAFRLNEPLPPGAKPDPSQSTTPQPPQRSVSKPLNASAPDFKPTDTDVADVSKQHADNIKVDSEDGEINDKKVETSTDLQSAPAVKEETLASSERPSQTTNVPSRPGSTRPITILKRPQSQQPERSASENTTPDSRSNNVAENARPQNGQQGQNRSAHALPARPDQLRPDHRSASRHDHERPGDRNSAMPISRPDSRDRRGQDGFGRLDRPTDVNRLPSGLQREHSPGRRSRPMTPERDIGSSRRDPRGDLARSDDRPPARSMPQDARSYERDTLRGRDNVQRTPLATPMDDGRRHGGNNMPPPNGLAPQGDRYNQRRPDQAPHEPSSSRTHPQDTRRVNMQQTEEVPAGVNPARLALIKGESTGTQNRPSRESSRASNNHDRRERSPRRADEHSHTAPQNSRPNDYRDRAEPPRQAMTPDSRRDPASDQAPIGPRIDRNGLQDPLPRAPTRDLFDNRHPNVAEPSHGRLNNPPVQPRQQESSYGRLNGGPDVPSGPRNLANQSNGRNAGPVQPRGTVRGGDLPQNAPSSPASVRSGPPTGPADRRQSGSSIPATPANEPAVHPDRFRNLPTIQTGAPSFAPRGPGGPPVGTPTGPSPIAKGPPSGPSSAASGGRNRNKQLLAGLNDALQGGGDRGASIRGRAGRANNNTMMPPSGPPAAQQSAPPPQSSRDISSRSNEAPNGPVVNAARASLINDRMPNAHLSSPASTPVNHPSSGRHEDGRQTDRRHQSRNASRERGPREDNDRRSDQRGSGHDMRNAQMSSRDDYGQRRDGMERNMRHGEPSGPGSQRAPLPPMQQAGPDPRSFPGTPEQYGNRGRGPLEEPRSGPRMNDRPRDEYRGGDGRGLGRPDMRDDRGYDGRDDRNRDGRKRRGEDIPLQHDPKRRRSGMQ